MILNFDLETWLKVTVHTSSKGTLQEKYESDWAKRREDMPWTSIYIMISSLSDRRRNVFLVLLLLSFVTIKESYILFAIKNHSSSKSC